MVQTSTQNLTTFKLTLVCSWLVRSLALLPFLAQVQKRRVVSVKLLDEMRDGVI
jgi:hypothetical protein